MKQANNKTTEPRLFSLLKPYTALVSILLLFAFVSNGISLWLPKIISHGIDDYIHSFFAKTNLNINSTLLKFSLAVFFIFLFGFLQSIVQTYTSEKVARDLRTRLSNKISRQSNVFIDQVNPSKLLTNLTLDVDSIKLFVSQALVSIVSSVFTIIGGSILLLTINWKLALCVIIMLPILGGTFAYVLRKVRALFKQSREVIDWLNKVINESILGAALIRVINSQQPEFDKFLQANSKAKDFGLSILRLFAGLIPIIGFMANLITLGILAIGGHFIINGTMSLGNFAAFNSYLAQLIFPIFVIGLMTNIIAQATASFQRINSILTAVDTVEAGSLTGTIEGNIELKDVSMTYGQKPALKTVSFTVKAGSKVAIIGPTAAGKTQLLYLLNALIKPSSGEVLFDGKNIDDYASESFHSQVGFVFQDSIIFNMSIRENIAFSDIVTDESLSKAIDTAELRGFIDELPEKLSTVVSERGLSLSGGQKQRVMLARALAINPRVLLLDDFTSRVDHHTEKKILTNLQENYPDLTLLSVTQKIASVEHYDQIILLMQGEIVVTGKHDELMHSSPEYVQIFNSQRSTGNHELQSE